MTLASSSLLPLILQDISLIRDKKKLLKNINCQFEANRRYIIIGPNGAGKSLLLRVAHGLISPNQGHVFWHSDNINQQPNLTTRIHGQAMVTQRSIMLRRSARDNIDYALSVRKVEKKKRNALIDDVIHKTGLKRIQHKPAHVLSLGEQQRLAIARAWALRPKVLFLDEPTASLDPPATYIIEKLLREISDEGTTLIMTSHDLGQARRLATDIAFMFRGHLKELRSADAFFQQPENDLAQAFIKGELLWWKRTSC